MATGYGTPRLVTDSLALCLDSTNRKSYTSGSSVWRDLSNNGNHGTMYGTVPYSFDQVNCFDFTSVTTSNGSSSGANMGFTFTSNMVQTTGNFTFSCWVKNPTGGGQTSLFTNTGGADGYRFGIRSDGIYFLISGQSASGYTEGGVSFLSSLTTTQWHNIVAIFNRNSLFVSVYVDGVYQSLTGIPSGQTAFSNNPPGIIRNPCCSIDPCKLAILKVYNKDLSQNEITQNFNALRRRFSI